MLDPRVRRRLILGSVGLGTFVILCAGTLGGVAYAYKGRFYPGTRIGSIDVGGLPRAEAEARVAAAIDTYQSEKVVVSVADLTKARDEATGRYPDTSAETTAKDLGLSFDAQPALAAAWATGHTYDSTWFSTAVKSIFSGAPQALHYSVDNAKIETFLTLTLGEKLPAPKPASIVLEGASVKIADASDGMVIDAPALTSQVASRLATATDGNPTIYVRAEATKQAASVTRDTLQPIADRLNSIGDVPLTMAATGVSLKPDRATKLSWFTILQDDTGALSLAVQQDKVANYLKSKAGSALDLDKSGVAAVKALSPLADSVPKTVSVALVAAAKKEVTPGSYTLGDFEGKYVEVNLAEQKLYRINGNTLEKTYVVSSGKWSTPTPKGTYTLSGHIKRAWSISAKLWMPYWVNFKGPGIRDNEYGIHALPEWPNGYKEGLSHLGSPVSHGCIRLGDADAAEMYDWIVDGTPIIIR